MKDMTAALIIENRRILLVHNTKKELRIEPPGGKKEDGEDLESCVIREVREELGILIKLIRLFGVYDTKSPEGDFRVYMYFSEIAGGEIKLKEPEKISRYGWYSFEDMKKFNGRGVLVPNLSSALNDLKKYFN